MFTSTFHVDQFGDAVVVGFVVSIVNVAQVILPAKSVTINVYVHSVDITVQLVYGDQLSIAPEILTSLNVIV
jgi:hypothetical protein